MFKKLVLVTTIYFFSLSAIAGEIPSEKVLTERFEQAGIVKNDQWTIKDGARKGRTYRVGGFLFYIYGDYFGTMLLSEKEPNKENTQATLVSCLSIPTIAFNGLSIDRKEKVLATIKTAYLKPNQWIEEVIDGLMFKVKKSSLGGYPILYCDVASFDSWD